MEGCDQRHIALLCRELVSQIQFWYIPVCSEYRQSSKNLSNSLEIIVPMIDFSHVFRVSYAEYAYMNQHHSSLLQIGFQQVRLPFSLFSRSRKARWDKMVHDFCSSLFLQRRSI